MISTSSLALAVVSAIFVPPPGVAMVKSPFDAVAVVAVLLVKSIEPAAASMDVEVDARSAMLPARERSATLVAPVSWRAVEAPLVTRPRLISTASFVLAVCIKILVLPAAVAIVKSPFVAVAVVDVALVKASPAALLTL